MTASTPISVGKEVAKGTFWIYAASYGGKFFYFLSTLVLARLLSQDDYGVVGYATVVISFLDVLSDLGIGPALIYHKENPKTADTAFWLGMLIAAALYGLSWLVAPLAGWYFNDPRAIPIIRTLALVFPISAFSNIHNTLLKKNLGFRQKFLPDFIRSTSKGLLSIVLALLGLGPWSLILGQLLSTLLSTVVYWRVLPWWPTLRFDRVLARSLLTYGLSIVGLNGLASLLTNVDYLFVGRFLGTVALGTYTMAFRIPDLLISEFCLIISVVLFPVYVRVRDESAEALNKAFLNTLRYISLVTIPMGLGLALVARPFVLAFLTAKWMDAVPVIQSISIFSMLFSLSLNTGSLYKAQGRVDVMVKLALVRLGLIIPAMFFVIHTFGTIASVGWAQAAVATISGTLNLYVAARMVGTDLFQVWKALQPAALSGIVMALAVFGLLTFTAAWPPLFQILLAILSGGAVYAALLYWQEQKLVLQLIHTLQSTWLQRGSA